MDTVDIIRYIAWYATENGISLTTNRLVKFLYLADLYHARIKNGKTMTDFPWRFVYYGPYCSEAMQAIEESAQKGIICKKTLDSHFAGNNEYHLFSCYDNKAETLEEKFHIGVIGHLQKAIKKLGDDTPQLLDYIYFETEPMKDAKKGDLLDFLKANRIDSVKTIKLKKLSPEVIKQARAKIKKIGENLKADQARLIQDERNMEKYKDDSYYNFIKFLNGEELNVGLSGTAKIQVQE